MIRDPEKRRKQKRAYDQKQAAAGQEVDIRKCRSVSRRRRLLKNPASFCKFYFPSRFFRPFTADQLEAMSLIENRAAYGADEIFCAERGGWKTETYKHMVIYLMCKLHTRFPVLIGATASAAYLNYEDIKDQFQSELLSNDFPEICDPLIALGETPQKKLTWQGESLKITWRMEYCIFPTVNFVPTGGKPSPYSAMKLTYRGLDAAIRGINIKGDRPDIAFLDDLETEESATSTGPKGQIQKREERLDNAVGGLGGQDTIPRIVLGTIQNDYCLTAKKLKEWGGKRYQAVKVWPDDPESVRLRDEFVAIRVDEKETGSKNFEKSYKFYRKHRKAIEKGVVLGSPHNFSQKKRENGRRLELSAFHRVLIAAAHKGWDYVWSELQNDPQPEMGTELRLTARQVATRISGFQRNEIPKTDCKIVVGLDLGKYWSHWVKLACHGNAVEHVIDYGIMETPGANKVGLTEKAHELLLVKAMHNWRVDMLASNPPEFGLIDSGAFTQAAYQFIREVNGKPFAAAKNWDKGRFKIPDVDTMTDRKFLECYAKKQEDAKLWLYHVHIHWWRQWVQQRFTTQTFDDQHQFNDGSLSLFATDDSRPHHDISKHVVSWEWQAKASSGVNQFEQAYRQKNLNDHYLDALAIACCAAGCLGIRLMASPPIDRRPAARPAGVRQGITTPTGEPFLVTNR